jgi:large subunit ribosomal protein L30
VTVLVDEGSCLAIVRIRGSTGISKEREEILRQLHLTRKNHATLVNASPPILGTLKRIKDYTTWGEVIPSTVEFLLREKGMLEGNRRLTEEYVKQTLKHSSMFELASVLCNGDRDLINVEGLKPVFRLHPPRKGFGGIKRAFPKGALGYRGEAINSLLARMV